MQYQEENNRPAGLRVPAGFGGVLPVGCGRARTDKAAALGGHGEAAVVLFLTGSGTALCGDRGSEYLPGSLVAAGPAASLRIFPAQATEYEYLLLRPGEGLLDSLEPGSSAVCLPESSAARQRFSAYVRRGAAGFTGGTYRESAALYALLMELLAAADERGGALSDLVSGAAKILRTDYAYLQGVDDVARRLGVDKSHLIRRFTAEMGLPPGRYLQRMRLDAACLLLANRDYSVETVAQMVGYACANYFCKVFRRQLQVTPGEYRQRTAGRLSPAEATALRSLEGPTQL